MRGWGASMDGGDAEAPTDNRSPKNGLVQDHTSEVTEVAIAELTLGESPRSAGIDEGHARLLADSDSRLPPLLVHRPSMRVLDGAHRLRAATLRGDDTIQVRFMESDEADAFVAAVEANVRHGLPLSLTDRRSAARRILESHRHWSDRAIASVVGLSPTTVARVRNESTAQNGQSTHLKRSEVRRGRDGRVRPVSSADGRLTAARLLEEDPGAPLQDVADRAGISVRGVRDVRRRLHQGQPVVVTPSRRSPASRSPEVHANEQNWPDATAREHGSLRNVLRRLKADRRLMSSRELRLVIQWVEVAHLDDDQLRVMVEQIPQQGLFEAKVLCEAATTQLSTLTSALTERLDSLE